MSENVKREKRKSIRSLVVDHEVNGLLTKEGQDRREPFLIWDVSEEGLCIWTGEQISPGDVLALTVVKPLTLLLKCKVRWCGRQEIENGYRCGLEVIGSVDILKKLQKTLRR